MFRLASLGLLIIAWFAGSMIAGEQMLPSPTTVLGAIFTEARSGELFFQLTSANVDKPLAIVLDDKVKAGARISEAIRESVQITGFDRDEATDLALVLRTAALPVDLIVENQQAIGASLGEDSIRQGLNAISLGGYSVTDHGLTPALCGPASYLVGFSD